MPEPSRNAEPARAAAPASTKRRWIAIGAVACVAVVLFGIGLYRYEWDGAVTRIVTEVVPYPAAIVDGHVVRYADFQEDIRTLERFYEAERGRAAPGSRFPSEAEIRTRVLDRLIKDRLALSLATRHGLAVTTEDVKRTYDDTILDQAALGTAVGKARAELRAEKTLDDLYGLSSSEFKSKILYPFLVRQRLEKLVSSDPELNAEKIKKAEAALADLKSGTPFKEVAAAMSDDPTAAETGGERGWMGRGLLPPEVEEAAFALEPGAFGGPIKSALGWHVIQVADRLEKAGAISKVKLREIIIRPVRLDDYLEAQAKKASIIIFVQ